MAGKPKRKAMVAELVQRTRAMFPNDPSATPRDYVKAAGVSVTDLASDLGVRTPALQKYLDSLDRPGAGPATSERVRGGSPHLQQTVAPARDQREIFAAICDRWALGETVKAAAAAEGIAVGTYYRWRNADHELGERHARAR